MDLSVEIPNNLTDVSNGKFVGKTDLGDGYTRWDWHVSYPINNYDVSLNIGDYVHFGDRLGDVPSTSTPCPPTSTKPKPSSPRPKACSRPTSTTSANTPSRKTATSSSKRPTPAWSTRAPSPTATYFENGYLGRDWTGVGISPRFDFIIIHESGHEWFGNSITAADPADMWIHEGWTTYLESLYVEYRWGKDDAIKYLNGYKPKSPQPPPHRRRTRRQRRAA